MKKEFNAQDINAAGSACSGHEALSVDAVVFDMDGLLLDTETLARRAILLAGQELGLGLTQEFCALLIGVAADGNRRLLLEHYGETAPADALFKAAAHHLEALVDGGALQLKPGVIELLSQLDKAGLPYAVATSSARKKALHHLQRAGIAEHFSAIVTRDDVAHGKPHPDLFLRAAQAVQTPPGRCLALEDSYNGVRAAHAAGMPVIMIPDLLAPTEEMRQKCFCILQDLHAVTAMLMEQHERLSLLEAASPPVN
ncbi:MAG: HAD-superfamily hydrolase, subfamily variant 3 [Polaromonas sp.]|nr:HAD-superfamily hydrolase, subfamily variant 3 [Polaromonas sp.]